MRDTCLVQRCRSGYGACTAVVGDMRARKRHDVYAHVFIERGTFFVGTERRCAVLGEHALVACHPHVRFLQGFQKCGRHAVRRLLRESGIDLAQEGEVDRRFLFGGFVDGNTVFDVVVCQRVQHMERFARCREPAFRRVGFILDRIQHLLQRIGGEVVRAVGKQRRRETPVCLADGACDSCRVFVRDGGRAFRVSGILRLCGRFGGRLLLLQKR